MSSKTEFDSIFGVMLKGGRKAVMGEVRTWGSGQFKKTPDGWIPVKGAPAGQGSLSLDGPHNASAERSSDKPAIAETTAVATVAPSEAPAPPAEVKVPIAPTKTKTKRVEFNVEPGFFWKERDGLWVVVESKRKDAYSPVSTVKLRSATREEQAVYESWESDVKAIEEAKKLPASIKGWKDIPVSEKAGWEPPQDSETIGPASAGGVTLYVDREGGKVYSHQQVRQTYTYRPGFDVSNTIKVADLTPENEALIARAMGVKGKATPPRPTANVSMTKGDSMTNNHVGL